MRVYVRAAGFNVLIHRMTLPRAEGAGCETVRCTEAGP
jgi:hypothetical protein